VHRDHVSGISAAGAEDTPAIRRFLASVFETNAGAPSLAEDLMRWKYHEPHPEWPGARAFVLWKNSRIAAHLGIVPVTWLTAGGPVTCVVPIDWAADPLIPGAGAVLHRKLGGLASTVLQIGGTPQARKMAELLGLRLCASLDFYVRVVRPLRQHRLRPAHDWKSPARLARNSLWGLARLATPPRGWSAEPVSVFDDSMLPPPTPDISSAFIPPVRSAALLNYLLRCPTAEFRGYLLRLSGRPSGFFLLSSIGPQTRIADLFTDSADPAAWTAAYALAARVAQDRPETCEIAALASTGIAREALANNGFRPRGGDPAWVFDPNQLLDSGTPLRVTMLEWDGSFLYNPEDPFLS
jgi:hypothetical protein